MQVAETKQSSGSGRAFLIIPGLKWISQKSRGQLFESRIVLPSMESVFLNLCQNGQSSVITLGFGPCKQILTDSNFNLLIPNPNHTDQWPTS